MLFCDSGNKSRGDSLGAWKNHVLGEYTSEQGHTMGPLRSARGVDRRRRAVLDSDPWPILSTRDACFDF